MPVPNEPSSDAAAVSAAMRALAHSTRAFPDPDSTYPVIGDLLSCVGSLRQVLPQIGDTLHQNTDTVHSDTGSRSDGRAASVAAQSALRQAAAVLQMTEDLLDRASQASGRITWPTPTPHPPTRPEATHPVLAPSPVGRPAADVFPAPVGASLRIGRS